MIKVVKQSFGMKTFCLTRFVEDVLVSGPKTESFEEGIGYGGLGTNNHSQEQSIAV